MMTFFRSSHFRIKYCVQQALDLAKTELNILVLGPTGSGKEELAKQIHEESGVAGPLISVDCHTLSTVLIESELFGHVKGAFTDATTDRPGFLQLADKGTLFLDEIAWHMT